VKRVKYLASLTPDDVEGPIAVANAAIEAHEWDEAREALAPYLDGRPPARICTLMARIEAGEQGDKGREREWLARAVRAPRDRAWIADGYVSDRWLPVSPVTGAVDGFEWKAPVDAIGRGDDTLLIDEPIVPEPAPSLALPRASEVVEVRPATETDAQASPKAPPAAALPSSAEPRPKPAIFVPERPPDDPGVAQAESDESPTSLERLRAAQIR
jgi:HemY protein